MVTGTDSDASSTLSQDEAFGLLGNETRMELLQTLGEAGEPLSFTELRTRVGYADPGNFQYHLNKVTGHFVDRTDGGYQLRQAGRRVVMAVLSGTVTESPRIESDLTEFPCTLCAAPVEITYHEEHVRLFCTECDGHYGDDPRGFGAAGEVKSGYLGSLPIPPAAVRDRDASELYLAAATWGHAYQLTVGSGVCPECGSTIERAVSVCEEHDADESLCTYCDSAHPTRIHLNCTHCISEWNGRFDNGLLWTADLQRFLLEHGINLVAPTTNVWSVVEYAEDVITADPFEATFSFTIDDDTLTVTVGDDLQVVDACRE